MYKKNNMPLIIRKAEEKDLPFIHDLVRELAIFEKEEKEFTATLSMYEKDYKENVFQSIVAELDGEIVGMVLYYLTYSTWKGKMMYLEDFVVKEKTGGKVSGKPYIKLLSKKQKTNNAS